MSIRTYLDYIRCVAESHWKIPAFGYINNQDHRLVEPGQIFDERDTSDRAPVLLSAVARITCRNRLCSDFGIEDSRGTLLRAAFSRKDLASLVGAPTGQDVQ
jgi:hypothetical protein